MAKGSSRAGGTCVAIGWPKASARGGSSGLVLHSEGGWDAEATCTEEGDVMGWPQ